MGVVWRAVDTLIERRVALKELRSPPGGSRDESDAFMERALREARSAGRLNHPAIVAVHDVIAPTDDGTTYIVMEYVEAPTLADLIDRHGPLPANRVAVLGLGILDALDVAHAAGVVHRDVKPSNVLVADGDRIKLTDFGIALAAEDTRLTRSGVIGTHAYLAPERFDTGQAGPASDLWALGATLFHAVAGRAPFDRGQTTATVRAILFEDPPTPPCPPPLADAIAGLLTRPVDQRHTSGTTRQLLQRAAIAPTDPAPLPPPDPTSGQASWQTPATTVHPRPPTTPPPPGAPPWGPPTNPGGPPPTHPTQPGGPPPPNPAGPPTPLPPAGPSGPAGPPTSPTHTAFGAGPPPPRSNKGWIVGGALATAAAAVLAFVVLSGGSGGGSDGPDGVAERLLEATKDQDVDAARAVLCDDDVADSVVTDDLGSIGLASYTIDGVIEEGGITKVQATMQLTGPDADATSTNVEIPVVQEDGTWKVCYSRLIDDLDLPDQTDTIDPGSGSSDTTEAGEADDPGTGTDDGRAGAEAVAQEFVDAVNSGDEAAADELQCSDNDPVGDSDPVGDAVSGNASFEIDPSTADYLEGLRSLHVDLTGSVDGRPIVSSLLAVGVDTDDTWCVDSFSFSAGVAPPAGYEPTP